MKRLEQDYRVEGKRKPSGAVGSNWQNQTVFL